MCLYRFAHRGSPETDISKMQLKECETKGLEGIIRYRSELAQGHEYYSILREKDKREKSSIPILSFTDLAHHRSSDGKESVMTFDDLVTAYKSKIHAQAADFGKQKVDPEEKGRKMSLSQFKRFYAENPIVR